MPTPHKHAKIIKAWADGHTIQMQYEDGTWHDLKLNSPSWEAIDYRIKPEPQIVECFVDIEQGHIVFTKPFAPCYKKATLTIHPDE